MSMELKRVIKTYNVHRNDVHHQNWLTGKYDINLWYKPVLDTVHINDMAAACVVWVIYMLTHTYGSMDLLNFWIAVLENAYTNKWKAPLFLPHGYINMHCTVQV